MEQKRASNSHIGTLCDTKTQSFGTFKAWLEIVIQETDSFEGLFFDRIYL